MSAWNFAAALAAAACLAACQVNVPERRGQAAGMALEVERSELHAAESRTLAHLAALEASLEAYLKANRGRIPGKLDVLVPKYISEIPSVELKAGRHRPGSEVRYYPADVIRDEVVDGTRLRDSGRWGYVHNGRQVIIFVDCTHQSSRGRPWYQERGVF